MLGRHRLDRWDAEATTAPEEEGEVSDVTDHNVRIAMVTMSHALILMRPDGSY